MRLLTAEDVQRINAKNRPLKVNLIDRATTPTSDPVPKPGPRKGSKYGNVKTVIDGIEFDSKRDNSTGLGVDTVRF